MKSHIQYSINKVSKENENLYISRLFSINAKRFIFDVFLVINKHASLK